MGAFSTGNAECRETDGSTVPTRGFKLAINGKFYVTNNTKARENGHSVRILSLKSKRQTAKLG